MTSSDLNGPWRDVNDAATPGEHNILHLLGHIMFLTQGLS
jgi:hypothetical protein